MKNRFEIRENPEGFPAQFATLMIISVIESITYENFYHFLSCITPPSIDLFTESRARMKIPTMENVYQTIRKQQQIMMRERDKIKKIKEKLGGKATITEKKIVYSYTSTDNL